MTINNNAGPLLGLAIGMRTYLNPLSSINWRASLVPAAAVIPAPIAYIKVVAVKKLVVGFLARSELVRTLMCVNLCCLWPSLGEIPFWH